MTDQNEKVVALISPSLCPLKLHGLGPVAVVDDDPSDLEIIEWVIKKSKIDNPIELFTSGFAVLQYLDRVWANQAPAPSIVLLDINMPGLSGYETLDIIRKRPVFNLMPVVVILTTSTGQEDLIRATTEGVGFKTKPDGIKEWIAFMDSLVPE